MVLIVFHLCFIVYMIEGSNRRLDTNEMQLLWGELQDTVCIIKDGDKAWRMTLASSGLFVTYDSKKRKNKEAIGFKYGGSM